VPSGIFEPKRKGVAGDWRRLHDEELHNFTLHQTFRVLKSRRIRWAVNVKRMGEMRNAYKILVGKSEKKRRLGRPMGRRIMLEWILEKQVGKE